MDYNPKEMADSYLRTFHQASEIGSHLLEDDLQRAEPYNHSKPTGVYADKNSYFNRANSIGYPFVNKGLTGLSKIYYWKLLNQINAFEKKYHKPLNKGMVSANLGVSDLAEGDIDGGVAHLLWAGFEDRAWVTVSYTHDIFQMKLYTQFANGESRNGLSQFGGPAPHVMLENTIKEYNKMDSTNFTKEDIFKELRNSDEHRAILEGALWTIARNFPIITEERETIFLNDQNNIYTKLRLFNGLVDLCRFIEIRIRHHENPPKNVKTLGNLFQYVFGNKTLAWFDKEVLPNLCEPQTGQEFDDFIKHSLKLKFPARNILLLWGTRNYSVHVCDPGTPYLFSNFDNIFHNILSTYPFYLHFKGVL